MKGRRKGGGEGKDSEGKGRYRIGKGSRRKNWAGKLGGTWARF